MDEPVSADAAETSDDPIEREPVRLSLDGWRCESFEHQTGHAVGRSVKHNETGLVLCLTVPETDGSCLPTIPASVMSWLLGGLAE